MTDDTTTTEAETEEVPEPRDEAREELLAKLQEALGDSLLDSHIVVDRDIWIRVTPEAWQNTARVLREQFGARYFGFLSAIDWMPSPYGRSHDSAVDNELLPPKEDELLPDAPAEPDTEATGDAAVTDGDADASEDESSIEAPAGTGEAKYETGFAGGETRFQVFARVASVGEPNNHWGITVKADVPEDTLTVDSWTSVYAGADWHEREAWEMFGINFEGHPGLRNMYLPSGFKGNPLRKDFPLVSRQIKPWPGIVDIEQMPETEEEDAPSEGSEA